MNSSRLNWHFFQFVCRSRCNRPLIICTFHFLLTKHRKQTIMSDIILALLDRVCGITFSFALFALCISNPFNYIDLNSSFLAFIVFTLNVFF